jgi:A/G-specific adenine glycosylase
MTRKTSPRDTLASRATEFQRVLLAWYRREARVLPWREQPSPYKTVVSEFMLQQTQVKTVLPYFARWLEVLPDFAALARADEAQVLKLWEGLGYYSRARNLHRLAQAVASRPALPRTPEDWRALPGVGPYTAAAITSIAFGVSTACVDGNVVRILARLTADETPYRDSTSAAKEFTALANTLVPATDPGDHNQAMMELGATVCTRAKPLCLTCPVRDFCAGAATGEPERLPRLAPKVIETREVTRLWCEQDGRLLLHRTPSGARRLANVHELPTPAEAGLNPRTAGELILQQTRGITRFRITESIHRCAASPAVHPNLVWVSLDKLAAITLSGPHRRWIGQILANRLKAPARPAATPRAAAKRAPRQLPPAG